ncbi:hypothetical protein CKY39_20600 [Variovorax boronicumulans]|uniref:Phage portal protein n=1 Tax=Variovorax boronicumulans TaxID=436515 RepID=A0A250DMY9_9BURK|nr:hypothetical protein CKY39_20600 [Variovorax boronicumulans]
MDRYIREHQRRAARRPRPTASAGRDLRNNNDYARKFCGMVETNMVGPSGFVMQSRVEGASGTTDKLANDAIEAAFLRWQAVCDVAGRQSLRDMCETLVGGLPSDGEFLVRMVRGADARNEFNFALQLIDVDRIDTTYNGVEHSTGNTVIMGVEVDAYRRMVAIHIFEAHPNDGPRTSRQRVRLPGEDLIHGFKVERAEQVRGIPWMAPGMLSLHHLGASCWPQCWRQSTGRITSASSRRPGILRRAPCPSAQKTTTEPPSAPASRASMTRCRLASTSKRTRASIRMRSSARS